MPSDKVMVDRAELERLIDNALKSRDEKKKQADEEEKKAKEAAGHPVGSVLTLAPVWRNGLWLESPQKDFTIHVGGTFQFDAGWFAADQLLQSGAGGVGPFFDGTNFRRARIRLEGAVWEVMEYEFVYEFFNAIADPLVPPREATVFYTPAPTEFWVQFRNLPWLGNVRIGNLKEWFSLEHLTSHRFLEFMERSPLFDSSTVSAFNNGYNPGISAYRTWCDEHVFTGGGVYKNVGNTFGFAPADGQLAVTGRIVGLPVWEDDGERLLHIGAAVSHRDPINDGVRLRSRPSVRAQPAPLLPILIDTGRIDADSHDLFNIETAAVYGPFTIQAEYTGQFVQEARMSGGPNLGTLYFQGAYVQALVFLTREKRPYNRRFFVWNRIEPLEPFFFVDGCGGHIFGKGAWELGVRYSYLDASDRAVQAGRLDDVTLGLNWYLNANAKIQFNYDITRRGDVPVPGQGVVHSFGTRLAFDF